MTVRAVNSDQAPAAISPHSQAIIAGRFLVTAGQIALEPGDNARRQRATLWRRPGGEDQLRCRHRRLRHVAVRAAQNVSYSVFSAVTS